MRNAGVILFVVALIVAGAVFLQRVRRVSVPQRQLLCQLRPGEQDVSFVWPKGHHFNLVIGVPKNGAASGAEVSGKLLLKAGTNLVGEFVFDTQKSTTANWLEKENLDAYVITLPINNPPRQLDQQVKDGSLIDLHIEAKASSENATSLWLTYLTRRADLKK
jgi:hypothetical protein